MPSKGVRNSAIDALEAWYHVPERSLIIIRDIVSMLHSCSLMYASSSIMSSHGKSNRLSRLDDIQDNSILRRGYPSTHTVFGVGQTINSANLILIKALKAAESLSHKAVAIFSGMQPGRQARCCLLGIQY